MVPLVTRSGKSELWHYLNQLYPWRTRKPGYLGAYTIEEYRQIHSTSTTKITIYDSVTQQRTELGLDAYHLLCTQTKTAKYNRLGGSVIALLDNSLKIELGKGRLLGATHFTLFMYPPPRGDYFAMFDKHGEEVHRFTVYIPISRVLALTTDPAAPTFRMQKISEFHTVATWLGMTNDRPNTVQTEKSES